MKFAWMMIGLVCTFALAANDDNDRARRNGPGLGELSRLPGVSAHEALAQMFLAIERTWVVPDYAKAGHVLFQAKLNADLPASSLDRRLKSNESVDFDLDIEGTATPNGRYHMELRGDLGEVALTHDLRRTFVSSQGFKSFSDTPVRARSKNANLTNYRSYLLRRLGGLKSQILQSGAYQSVYVGSQTYGGRDVHVIRVYKPGGKKSLKNKKAPMALNKLWTFWHDGGYEIWIYQTTKLPAVVFYTNIYDDVYANFTIDYDQSWMPARISFQNNSLGAEGSGDLVFQFNRDRVLTGLSLKFQGVNGVSLYLDATLLFGGEVPRDAFRIIPPFGFRKLNRDHLKLMLLTQISGGLLKLKKHGLNIKNFKF